MYKFINNIFFLTLFSLLQVDADVVRQVDDSNLVYLLTREDNIVVLFTKKYCPDCDKLQSVLEDVQDLFIDKKIIVVKTVSSQMVGLYNPSKEPALVYFRRGVPLLYYGPPNAEDIFQVFSDNIAPIVKELSDINFEHLTQAGTGATTGDWFIFFYSPECVFCLRLHAIWEAVGARFKLRLNVARIDRKGAGVATAERFGVVESPEFLLLRHGKIYRYKKREYTVRSFIEFVEKDFMEQTNPELVQPERNYINTISSSFSNFIVKNSNFWILLSLGVLLLLMFGCAITYVSLKWTTVKHTIKAKKAK